MRQDEMKIINVRSIEAEQVCDVIKDEDVRRRTKTQPSASRQTKEEDKASKVKAESRKNVAE